MFNVKKVLLLVALTSSILFLLIPNLEEIFSIKITFTNQPINETKPAGSRLLDFNLEPSNPIQEYFILKEIYGSVTNSKRLEELMMLRQSYFYENSKDWQLSLNQLTMNIARLQNIYNISVTELMNGELLGFRTIFKLSPIDCYEIANSLIQNKKIDLAIEWFEKAFTMWDNTNEKNQFATKNLDILLNLADTIMCNVPTTSIVDSISFIWDMFTVDTNGDKLLEKLYSYRRFMRNLGQKSENEKLSDIEIEHLELLKEGCQGKLQPLMIERNLFCKYQTKNHPFLILAPIKMEYISINPLITIFYDIISDDEIEYVIKFSKNKLKNAKVYSEKTNTNRLNSRRVSQIFSFDDHFDPFLLTLNQRIEDATGFSTESGESLQVNKYEFGGWYGNHYDSFEGSSFNRISTLLLYLSDVIKGGSTVFPLGSVSMLPRKGSAIYWFNMHPSGKLDYMTLHSGCPVVVGTKWVANKWFKHSEQISKMQCKKNFYDVWTIYDV